MMSFIRCGSEFTGFPMVTSEMGHSKLYKNALISYDSNPKKFLLSSLIYLKIASTYISNGYPKLKFRFGFLKSQTNHVLRHFTGTIL